MDAAQQTERLLGESPAFLEVLDQVSQIAPLDKPVLIVGERGTGKELIAARLHYLSRRWDQEYIKMNCAAINETLLETELFGHDAGAFTGATRLHRGRFERADKGSLFMDELASTSALVQEKLLRVIEYGEFERVGGSKTLTTDVRLIAATNEDLPVLAEQGKFRMDLLDRLAFDVITLPPLRARTEDILILAEHFAVNMVSDLGLDYFPGFSEQARETLMTHSWRGNIRELKNAVERSVYRFYNSVGTTKSHNKPVDVIALDPFDSIFRPEAQSGGTPAATVPISNISPASLPTNFRQAVQEFEIDLIKHALARSQFNQKKTAEALGVTYHQLRGYLKKYALLDKEQSADS